MRTYKVRITELLSRTVTVKAENMEQAYKEIKEKYDKELIVLDSDDFVESNIDVLSR